MALKVGSIVSNIVQKAGTFDQKVIDESIERLAKKSEHLRGELYELVKRSYVDFDSYVSISITLEQRAQSVKSEYQKISARIEQDLNSKIAETFHKKEEIESKLKDTKSRIVLIQHMVDIYQAVEASRSDVQAGKYKTAAEKLSSAFRSLSVLAEGGCDALVFRALKSEQASVVADLVVQLEQEWQKYIMWSPKVIPNDPSLDFLSSIKLQLPVLSAVDEVHMKEVIEAMKHLSGQGVWGKRATLFSNKLLKLFLKPLIVHGSLKITQINNKKQIVLGLLRSDSVEVSVVQLFDTLASIFQLVGHVVVAEYRGEWLQMVGNIVCPEVEDLVVAHRLSNTIPRSLSELEEYEIIQLKTEEFESAMTSIGLSGEGTMSKMSKYTNDINAHFVMQKSQDMLVKARSILMQPIDDTIIAPSTSQDPILKLKEILSSSVDQEGSGNNYGTEFSNLAFKFPQCSVSKSVQEYISLLYLTLKECVESTSTGTGLQLFHMARSMVDLFCAVLPTYHSSAISEFPRVAAVQYNNCMFLAHYLVTLGHHFYSRLPPPLNQQLSTFIDYVPIVRRLGDDCLSMEMKRQCTYVIGCLKSIGSFAKVSADDHRETVWQSLQEAVFRIGKVSKIYYDILPTHMHREVVGKLLDVFILDVTQMVLLMEDITAADATELHALLKMLVSRASQVLLIEETEGNAEVAVASKNWGKLRSLSIVLNASLLEITDMWDGGKGSLAKNFTVGEARGLIKALFRNTERRAAALNKIIALEI